MNKGIYVGILLTLYGKQWYDTTTHLLELVK